MVAWWLERRDHVLKVSGTPTLNSLIEALETNGLNGHAEKIKEENGHESKPQKIYNVIY